MKSAVPKRVRHRNRWRRREELRALDAIALKRIQKSYIASSSTWGGSRCPDCGIQVRPCLLVYPGCGLWTANGKVMGHITMGVLPPCDYLKGCKGEAPDWEVKASNRSERRRRL